jgi:hypothetical protein
MDGWMELREAIIMIELHMKERIALSSTIYNNDCNINIQDFVLDCKDTCIKVICDPLPNGNNISESKYV